MKTLLIIVPKGSALDSYLVDAGFKYDEIVRLSYITFFKMKITKSLQLIDVLVSKFCLKDFSMSCYDGDVTFRVRS